MAIGDWIPGDAAPPTPKTNQFTPGSLSYELDAADINNEWNALVDQRTLTSGFTNVMSYGATGDGITNDRAAIVAALAITGKVYFPPGTYLVGSSFAIPASTILIGAGRALTTIKRGFTGDFITNLGDSSGVYDLTIDGDTATYGSGRGVLVAAGSNHQSFRNVRITNFVLACLEFALDAGSEFSSVGCSYYTTGTLNSVAAVKVTGTDTTVTPRKFYATASNGCTLFDFGGCLVFFASGFYSNGLIFGAAATRVMLSEMFLGSSGGTITVQGTSHVISGISQVAVSLSTTINSILNLQAPSWGVTETGVCTNNSITLVAPAYSITWTATTTNPVLNNGSLAGRWSRRGAWVRVDLSLTIGSSTTMGTGTWEFSLPVVDIASGAIGAVGTALAVNSAGNLAEVGAVRVSSAGGQKVRVYFKTTAGAASTFGAASPWAWGTGDTLRLSFEYRVP